MIANKLITLSNTIVEKRLITVKSLIVKTLLLLIHSTCDALIISIEKRRANSDFIKTLSCQLLIGIYFAH